MVRLDDLLYISSGFGQNCNFVFLAIFFFNCPFSPSVCGGIKDNIDSSLEFLIQSL